jgi:hypothetical protein
VTRFKVRIGSDAEAEFTQAFNWYKHRSHLAADLAIGEAAQYDLAG